MSTSPIWLCKAADVGTERPRQVCPKGSEEALAVSRIGDEFFLTEDTCTHALVSLSDGHIEDGVLHCPLHGGAFDIRTGKALEFPCTKALKTYAIERKGDDLYGLLA